MWAEFHGEQLDRREAARMTHTSTALVIGGGVAGPAAAMALQMAGIDSTVYEAHRTGAEGIGVFLTLASNGVDALRVLGADKPALPPDSPPGSRRRHRQTPRRDRTGQALSDGTTSRPSNAPTCTGCCTRASSRGA
jgi:2-polyprenyl-6-methoxyphenol hydroxylase-like FAD-dependent oxidoreductase